MADSILLSEDYTWTASFGVFELVLEQLAARVGDRETRERLQHVLDHRLGAVDVRELPAAGREQVLRALREDIVDAVAASPRLTSHEQVRQSTLGHVRTLKLMADDLARPPKPE